MTAVDRGFVVGTLVHHFDQITEVNYNIPGRIISSFLPEVAIGVQGFSAYQVLLIFLDVDKCCILANNSNIRRSGMQIDTIVV